MNYWIVSVYIPDFTRHWVRKAYTKRIEALNVAFAQAKMFPNERVYLKRCRIKSIASLLTLHSIDDRRV